MIGCICAQQNTVFDLTMITHSEIRFPLSLLHQTRACNASQEEILHENWRFLSIRLSVFANAFQKCASRKPVSRTHCPFSPEPDFQYFGNVYSKCSFADSRCLICEPRIFKVPCASLPYSSKNNLLHYGCKSTQKKKRKIEQTEGYLNQQSLRASRVL